MHQSSKEKSITVLGSLLQSPIQSRATLSVTLCVSKDLTLNQSQLM